MIPVYAIGILLGAIALIAWIATGLVAGDVTGKAHLDPETRYGSAGRYVVAGVLGFGLGGMSASFAGWPSILAGLAAGGGAAVLIGSARYLGSETEDEEAA